MGPGTVLETSLLLSGIGSWGGGHQSPCQTEVRPGCLSPLGPGSSCLLLLWSQKVYMNPALSMAHREPDFSPWGGGQGVFANNPLLKVLHFKYYLV